jgi:hypothetical protein
MRRSILIGLFALLGIACACGVGLNSPAALAQKAEPMPPAKGKQFELRLIRDGDTIRSIRFNVTTGESWMMVDDDPKYEKYEKVPETGAVSAGDYDVQLVHDGHIWLAFRIDRVTGTTWQLRPRFNLKWVKVKEPGEKDK